MTREISHGPDTPQPVRGNRVLTDACRAGLRRTDLGREGDEVAFERVLSMPHADIPFTPGRQGHLDVIDASPHGRDIDPIGRLGEWKYLNQDGAILSSKRVVEAVQTGETPRPAPRPTVRSNGTPRPIASA